MAVYIIDECMIAEALCYIFQNSSFTLKLYDTSGRSISATMDITSITCEKLYTSISLRCSVKPNVDMCIQKIEIDVTFVKILIGQLFKFLLVPQSKAIRLEKDTEYVFTFEIEVQCNTTVTVPAVSGLCQT